MKAKSGEVPRGRSEDEWLVILGSLIRRLDDAIGGYVIVGEYYISGKGDDANVSLVAYLRSRDPLPWVPSDSWEGPISIDGDRMGTSSQVLASLFLGDAWVTCDGPVVEPPQEPMYDDRWALDFTEAGWRSFGWVVLEGDPEPVVTKPGDNYPQSLACVPLSTSFSVGSPVLIEVDLTGYPLRSTSPVDDPDLGVARFSLISVNRDREGGNLVPWSKSPPKSRSPRVQRVRGVVGQRRKMASLDLTPWKIHGGWRPGKYRVSLRLQYRHPEDRSWDWLSEISPPIEFQIVEE